MDINYDLEFEMLDKEDNYVEEIFERKEENVNYDYFCIEGIKLA